MEGLSINLHACMGDTCYCKPGNEHRARWTEADKQRLTDALRKMHEREQAMKSRGLIGP